MWAIWLTDTGIEVVKLPTYLGVEEDVEEVSVAIHTFPSFNTSLMTIASNNGLSILRLVEDGEGWETNSAISNRLAIGYNLQIAEDRLQIDLLFDTATSYAGIDRITYHWDAEMGEFVEVERHAPNSLGVPFDEALDSAEALIFEEGDFTAAISILTVIAEEFDSTGEFAWLVSLPKTLYLLGLAHELVGNEGEAVAAYWRVWHDFPSDPYALMGAAKLEIATE